jgi:hypothetical protein
MKGSIPINTKLIINALRRKFSKVAKPANASSTELPRGWFEKPTRPTKTFQDLMRKQPAQEHPIQGERQRYQPYDYSKMDKIRKIPRVSTVG